MAKTRQIDCKQCGERVKRQYGYFRRGWKLGKTQYRMVYKCPKCGTSMALLTIEAAWRIAAGMAIVFSSPRHQSTLRRQKRKRTKNPWDRTHLSKAERKGKSYEDIQAARFRKWNTCLESDAGGRREKRKTPPDS